MTINNSNITPLNHPHDALYSVHVSPTQKILHQVEAYISQTIKNLEEKLEEDDDLYSTFSALETVKELREIIDLENHLDLPSHEFDFFCAIDSHMDKLKLSIKTPSVYLDESIMIYNLENIQLFISLYKKVYH